MVPSEVTMNMVNALQELQRPEHHRVVDLNIRKFKKAVREFNRGAPRSKINLLIKAYKRRAWMETDAMIRGYGSFPTHQVYGKKVKVSTSGMDVEYEVEVKSGQK